MQVLICGGDNVDSEQISYEQKISNMQSYLSFFIQVKAQIDLLFEEIMIKGD